ncbi:hypothetical protein BDZ91DRAFT_720341 [Kalaharituber pfeilii]|nr:hypothetical protein BDZ91DRAFT_720341 [Kalaharituber pfeilii]
MHSIFSTVVLPLLALSSAVSASVPLGFAQRLPDASDLRKRDVACGVDDAFCPDGYYCVTGDNGLPGCCPQGETCQGDGGIETVTKTSTFTVDHTMTSTYVLGTPVSVTATSTSHKTRSTSSEIETESETETETTPATSKTPEATVTTFETITTPAPCPRCNATATNGTNTSHSAIPTGFDGAAAPASVVGTGVVGLIAAIAALLLV